MKNMIAIIFLMLALMPWNFTLQHSETLLASTKGTWVLSDKQTVEQEKASPPLGTSIQGDEGDIICVATYKKQNVSEKAVYHWKWTKLPEKLLPKDSFEMTISGFIQEWETTHNLHGTLNVRLQPFGASCCSLEGSDLGTLRLDVNNGDEVGQEKKVSKKAIIPQYGELKSNSTQRIQIMVRLLQNSSNYQWIYVYEWRESTNRKVFITLTIGNHEAVVNGQSKQLDTAPFIKDNRTFVPFRFLGEAFGAEVTYQTDPTTKQVKTITYQLEDQRIILTINQHEAMVNNQKVLLDSPPVIVNQRTMVPVRFVSEQLKAIVKWDSKKQQILIEKE